MEINDFKVGNKAYFDFHKDSGGRKEITISVKDLANMEKGKIKEMYSPIPLTKEWLNKMPIYWRTYYHVIIGSVLDLILVNGNWKIFDNRFITIEYVHQLQNAYALSGYELTIKAPIKKTIEFYDLKHILPKKTNHLCKISNQLLVLDNDGELFYGHYNFEISEFEDATTFYDYLPYAIIKNVKYWAYASFEK